jgi:phospholipase C
MSMEKIRHLGVLMLENRSFDNMVDWLYANQGNHPPLNIPVPASGPTTYEGLSTPLESTASWTPKNEYFFTGASAVKEYVA